MNKAIKNHYPFTSGTNQENQRETKKKKQCDLNIKRLIVFSFECER